MSTITINHMKLHNNQVKMNSKTLMSSASEAKIQTKRNPKISLIIGGFNSGKSAYAIDYALGFGNNSKERAIIATSKEHLTEIKDRCILLDKDPENSFTIFQEDNYVPRIIQEIPKVAQIIIIDNISSWITNIINNDNDTDILENKLESLIKNTDKDIIIISNIVGFGIVPEKTSDKQFRNESGLFNQRLAKIADNVILMIAGIPLKVKGKLL